MKLALPLVAPAVAIGATFSPVHAARPAFALVPLQCEANGGGSLSGRTFDEAHNVVPFALVYATWKSAADAPISSEAIGNFTLSDERGAWTLCDLPLTVLLVSAKKLGLSDVAIAVLDSSHAADAVVLHMTPEAARTAKPVVVAVTVLNGQDEPVDASIELKTALGVNRLTAREGRALATLPAGQRIEVVSRAVGYKPGSVIATVEPGVNTIPLIMDQINVPMLSPMRVLGDREVLARHGEFEERRRLRLATVSITAEEIKQRNPASTWQMLTGIPSLDVIPFGLGVYAKSPRGYRTVPNGDHLELVPCWFRVMVDGVALPESMPDLSRLPAPNEIHGIEVFAGPATIPPRYNSAMGGAGATHGDNGCGLIAIWTR